MAKRFVVPKIAVIVVLMFSPLTRAQVRRQPGALYDLDKKGEKSAPAPRRDLSGIWEPAKGANDAVQADGAKTVPSDGKPEHEPPYSPEGRKAFLANKPTFGFTQVPSALTNDPMPGCDPQGFPRIALHNFRTSQILQTPDQVLILYEFNKKWRVIWTDGRDLPKDPEQPGWATKDAPQQNQSGGDTRLANGWMTTRSSRSLTDSMMEPGSIMLVARTATLCAWGNDTAAWIATTWK